MMYSHILVVNSRWVLTSLKEGQEAAQTVSVQLGDGMD